MKDKIKNMFESWKREEELRQLEQENRVSFAPPTPEEEYNKGKPAGKGQEGDIYVSKAWIL